MTRFLVGASLQNYFYFFSFRAVSRARAGDEKTNFRNHLPLFALFALVRRKKHGARPSLSLSHSLNFSVCAYADIWQSRCRRRNQEKEEKAHIHFLLLTA
jgi:hypothetical protein